jgi:hypothetical protein
LYCRLSFYRVGRFAAYEGDCRPLKNFSVALRLCVEAEKASSPLYAQILDREASVGSG